MASGLYTDAEIMARFNYRLYQFAKLTGALTNVATVSTVSGQRDYPLDDKTIDIEHVALLDTGGDPYTELPVGTAFETDLLLSSSLTPAAPSIWTLELGDVNTISLIPPPNYTGGTIHITYTRRPAALNPPNPPGAGQTIDMPDDFVPFCKYGALADLMMKSGEAYDPQRAQVYEALFQLGVSAVRGWVSGNIDNI